MSVGKNASVIDRHVIALPFLFLFISGHHEGKVVCFASITKSSSNKFPSETPILRSKVISPLVSAGVKDSGSPAETEEEAEDAHPTAERSTNASSSPGRRVSVLNPDHTLVKVVGAYGESDFRRRE